MRRTEQVAVAVGSVRAYPNGFGFTLHTRQRREDETGWRAHVILWPDDPDSEPGSNWTTSTMTACAHSTDTDLT